MPKFRAAVAVLAMSTAGMGLAAQAAHADATGTFKFPESNRVGKKGVALQAILENTRPDGRKPATTRQVDIFLPKQLSTNGKRFRACTLSTLTDPDGGREACPRGSKVGEGTARGQISNPEPATATSPAKPPLFENLDLAAFNGPGGKTLLINLFATAPPEPASINKTLEAELTRIKNATYGQRLRTVIPPDIQQPVPGLFVPLVDFRLNIEGRTTIRKKRVSFLRIKSCPKNRRLVFRTVFKFNPASGGGAYQIPTSDQISNTFAVCSKKKKK